MRKKLIVFTGAGISAESGIKTFRDSDGLWENHDVMDVATPQGWDKDFELVLEFYNARRKQALETEPNPGHLALLELEDKFDVQIITQNVDNLHERAGSANVLHLHGELAKSRSTADHELIYEIDGPELNPGDLCEKGSQLRPHIVWFGEMVPNIEKAQEMCADAHILIIIGTSLAVYPAAGIVNFAPPEIPKYFIDPKAENIMNIENLTVIKEKGGTGTPTLVKELIANEQHSK